MTGVGGTLANARRKGTLARLLNSSCAPNCETQKWHDAGTGEVRVGIFAAAEIAPGAELTYDYQFQHAGLASDAGAYRRVTLTPTLHHLAAPRLARSARSLAEPCRELPVSCRVPGT